MSDIKYSPEAVQRLVEPVVRLIKESELSFVGAFLLKDKTFVVVKDSDIPIQESIGFLEIAKDHILRGEECL